MCLDFLEIHGDDYEQILISDTRDVIFQGDVFEQFKGYKNFLGYSTESDDIRGSKTGDKVNYGWLVGCFGKEEANKLLDKKIICCGTVIATINEMKIFCREMWDSLKTEEVWGYEQAAMNYLVWNNLLPIKNLIEIDVHGGEVFTMGLFSALYPINIRDEKILRGDGGVPAVVHQYDRARGLVQLFGEIYRDKNFQADERFNDTRSTIEQTTSLLRADKIGEASLIFLKKFLVPDDFSIYGKSLMKLFEMLLNKPLSQPLKLLELAVQYSLTSVKNFSSDFFIALCNNLKRAKETAHPVDPEFKNYAANVLLQVADSCLRSNQPENCFWCIKQIEDLDISPNKNFYFFVAEVNRIFGRKDEALAAYKKVLELS